MTNQNQVFGQTVRTVNTRNNNTTKNMTSTKIQIAVNIGTKKVQSLDSSTGTITTVHNGGLRYNRNTMKCFVSFNPTPISEKANFTPVYRVDANGNRTELDRVEFWAGVCGTDANGNVKASQLTVQLEESAREMIDCIKHGAKSLLFTFDLAEAGNVFIYKGVAEYKSRKRGNVIYLADYRLSSAVTKTISEESFRGDETFLNSSVVTEAVKSASEVAPSTGISNVNDANATVTATTKSARRRAARKEAHAAQQAVQAPVASSGSMIDDIMSGTPAPKAAPVAQTPVTAPVVDAEKAALRAENAELKAEIKSLKEDNAEIKAMLKQLLAGQAQPAPLSIEAEAVEREAEKVETAPTVQAARASVASAAEKAPADFDPFAEFSDEDEEDFAAEGGSFDQFDADEDEEVDNIFGGASNTVEDCVM